MPLYPLSAYRCPNGHAPFYSRAAAGAVTSLCPDCNAPGLYVRCDGEGNTWLRPARPVAPHYLLTDLSTEEEVGVFLTLAEARRNIGHRPRYAIYSGQWDGEDFTHGQRAEFCDPYDGGDDRALQGLGLPNASEQTEDYQLDASQPGEDW